MRQIVFSEIGLIHLVTAVLALICGTLVLILEKGTVWHKRIGYGYVAAMLAVNLTAFFIYRLFGRFGVFHIMAIISTATILSGMIPVVFRNSFKNWLSLHFGFMYWSVMGLYAAFVAESLVRLPRTPFFAMVGIGTLAVMIGGAIFFAVYQKRWMKVF